MEQRSALLIKMFARQDVNQGMRVPDATSAGQV